MKYETLQKVIIQIFANQNVKEVISIKEIHLDQILIEYKDYKNNIQIELIIY